MPINYRRPGVYLEESLLVNPSDVGATTTVAAFVGVAAKGQINEPVLVESWSDYVTLYGGFELIVPPTPADPNDATSRLQGEKFSNLNALKSDPLLGDGNYNGPDFGPGQFVLLDDDSKAHYLYPPYATAKDSASPGDAFVAEPTVTAQDSANAAKLEALGYEADPATAWDAGEGIRIGVYAFAWDGDSWAPAQGMSNNNGTWQPDAYPGTGVTTPSNPQVLSYLPYSVYSFFQNGGRMAWIVRSAPTTGDVGTSATVEVTGANDQVTPRHAFKIQARSVGAWGNNLRYSLVTQESFGSPPNHQTVFALHVQQRNSANVDEVVETFQNLSMTGDISGSRRIDAVVNDPYIGSRYIVITDLNSQQPAPGIADAVALAGGVDPGIPDAPTLEDTAKLITKVEGPVNLNIAGYMRNAASVDTAQATLDFISAAVSADDFPDREDIFVINDNVPPRTPGKDSATYMTEVKQWLQVGVPSQDSYVACYAPWILIPHPQRIGTTTAIPPGGAIMGMIARIDATIGVFRAPAGVVAGLANAVGVQTKFTDSQLGDLNFNNVNIIRPVVGAGMCCMGGRTRKNFGPDHYISARRTLIVIKESLRRSTQFAVFENNDHRLWSDLRMTADRILRPMWEQGGLRGSNASEAYYIRCDDTLNTLQVISSGEVRMEVGVALEYPAEFVVIRITQYDRGTFTAEVQPAA